MGIEEGSDVNHLRECYSKNILPTTTKNPFIPSQTPPSSHAHLKTPFSPTLPQPLEIPSQSRLDDHNPNSPLSNFPYLSLILEDRQAS